MQTFKISRDNYNKRTLFYSGSTDSVYTHAKIYLCVISLAGMKE